MLSLSLSLFNFVHFTAAGSDNKKGKAVEQGEWPGYDGVGGGGGVVSQASV